MILVATQAEAAGRRRHYTSPHGAQALVDTYIGTNRALQDTPQPGHDAARLSPNAYLVTQAPGAELHPHYHQADQFQVFVHGSGRIGTHAVTALTVHFAAAHSPYGPVVAGPEGLQYLTLRRQWDPGAQWMPESAGTLRGLAARRHRVFTSNPMPVEAASVPDRECSVSELLHDGGMGAWLVELAPGAAWLQQGSGDHFVYVLQGTLQAFGASMDPHACLFASADEGETRFAASPGGARVVVVRFGQE